MHAWVDGWDGLVDRMYERMDWWMYACMDGSHEWIGGCSDGLTDV